MYFILKLLLCHESPITEQVRFISLSTKYCRDGNC